MSADSIRGGVIPAAADAVIKSWPGGRAAEACAAETRGAGGFLLRSEILQISKENGIFLFTRVNLAAFGRRDLGW